MGFSHDSQKWLVGVVRVKIASKFDNGKENFIKTIAIERKTELITAGTNGGKVFQHQTELVKSIWGRWGRLINGKCWALWVIPEFANEFSLRFDSVFANRSPNEIRLSLSHRDWELGVLFSIFIFQTYGSQILEKDIFWVIKLEAIWVQIYIYISKEQRKNLHTFQDQGPLPPEGKRAERKAHARIPVPEWCIALGLTMCSQQLHYVALLSWKTASKTVVLLWYEGRGNIGFGE